jgi:hypothetical protein
LVGFWTHQDPVLRLNIPKKLEPGAKYEYFPLRYSTHTGPGTIQYFTHLVPSAVSLVAMLLVCEAYHLPSSVTVVKNGGAIPPLSHTSSWR